MNPRIWTASIITLATLIACLYTSLVPQSMMPLSLYSNGNDYLVVRARPDGTPLPPGWQEGDVIPFSSLTPRDNAVMNGNPPAGTMLDIEVSRDGKPLRLPLTFIPQSDTALTLANYVSSIGMVWLFAALGLLLLWRGRRLSAAAVCMWCLITVYGAFITSLSLHLSSESMVIAALGMQIAIGLAYNGGTVLALYLLADDLTKSGIGSVTRRWARWIFTAALTLYIAERIVTQIMFSFFGKTLAFWQTELLCHLIGLAVPLYLLFACYRHAPPDARIRIRWVWASMLCFVGAYLVGVYGNRILNGLSANLLDNALTVLTFAGLTYAVLQHRLVSLQFVVNRTLVYGIITALVVGVFAAVSSLVDHFAVGKAEGLLLQLLIPLSMGITLSVIKKRLDGFVERLFFQRQYRAEARLARFTRECGFIQNRGNLLERTLDELQECINPMGVALYERDPDGEYALRGRRGDRRFPDRLGADDPAVVSLRAQLTEVNLDEMRSDLGAEGLAFPLSVRSVLTGVLAVGQRPAERYTKRESALLAQLSQQVAISLYALHAQEAEAFVQALARGPMPSSEDIRRQAQLLTAPVSTGA